MSPIEVIGADFAPSPRLVLEQGAVFLIGPAGSPTERVLTYVRRRAASGSSPGYLEFLDGFDQHVPLSDSQVAFLMRNGEFRKVESAEGERVLPRRDLVSIDADGERKRVERRYAYVKAVFELEPGQRRTRAAVVPVIEKVADKRDEPAPGFTTVLEWMDLWDETSDEDGLASLARKIYQRSDAPPGPVEQAIRVGITRKIGGSKLTAGDARTFSIDWLMEIRREDLVADLPTLRSFQRRIALVDRRLRAEGEYGPRYAARIFDAAYETKRPDLPLEAAEVDHTPFDVLLVSDDQTIVYGRPDVIAFRDRCTGSFLGLSIGFEAPSYASFLDGLRHAIYPKDMSGFPDVETPWFAWGRFRRLYVDNALHFIGHNIHRAAAQLKFEIAELPPASPALKGGMERLLGVLNMKAHKLPGATYSNVLERRDRAEIAKMPILTLSEIQAFLAKWICDEYHIEKHEGLGQLRTLEGIPKVLWDRSVSQIPIAPLPAEDTFVALAGDVDFRAINKKGIRWDHIRYQSADLEAIRANGKHRDGHDDGLFSGAKYKGSRYRVTRDPFDLSAIWVVNPYLPGKPSFKIPAVRKDYAGGLTLHQHRVNVANADAQLLKDTEETEDVLMRAKLAVARAIKDLLQIRKDQDIEKRLARYLWKGQQREQRSIVTTRKPDAQESALTLLEGAERQAKQPATPARVGKAAKRAVSRHEASPSFVPASPRPDAKEVEAFDPEAFNREFADNPEWSQT